MRPDPKYVIDLATKLEAAKATIEPLQAAWDALFPDVSPAPAGVQKVDVAMRESSAINRTLDYFNAHPSHEYNSSQISEALGIPVPSTRTNLAKLYKQGKLRKTSDGVYQAAGERGEVLRNIIPGAEESSETVREADALASLVSGMPQQAGETARAETDGYHNHVKAVEPHNQPYGQFRH